MMFAELTVGNKKVRVPFVCRMCGECCRKLGKVVFDPRTGRIYIEDLEVEWIEGLERYKDFPHPIKIPCPFLKGNRCEIHDIRPRSCREFPLLTGDLGVDCPALKSFERILKAFKPDKVDIKIVEGEVERIKIPRSFLRIFQSANPTKEEERMFLKLNTLEKNLNS